MLQGRQGKVEEDGIKKLGFPNHAEVAKRRYCDVVEGHDLNEIQFQHLIFEMKIIARCLLRNLTQTHSLQVQGVQAS